MRTIDSYVVMTCIGATCFWLGMEVGVTTHKVKVCPKVENQKVVSTHVTTEGQFCTYGSGYGRKLRKERV